MVIIITNSGEKTVENWNLPEFFVLTDRFSEEDFKFTVTSESGAPVVSVMLPLTTFDCCEKDKFDIRIEINSKVNIFIKDVNILRMN